MVDRKRKSDQPPPSQPYVAVTVRPIGDGRVKLSRTIDGLPDFSLDADDDDVTDRLAPEELTGTVAAPRPRRAPKRM